MGTAQFLLFAKCYRDDKIKDDTCEARSRHDRVTNRESKHAYRLLAGKRAWDQLEGLREGGKIILK
jgi:hypothetical protein